METTTNLIIDQNQIKKSLVDLITSSPRSILKQVYQSDDIDVLLNAIAANLSYTQLSILISFQNSFMTSAISPQAIRSLSINNSASPRLSVGARTSIKFECIVTSPVAILQGSRVTIDSTAWYVLDGVQINIGDTDFELTVKQGEFATENFTSDGAMYQSFLFGDNKQLDDTIVTVSVGGRDWAVVKDSIFLFDTINETLENVEVAVQKAHNIKGTLINFGNNLTGKAPPIDDIITIGYYTTLGHKGNSIITPSSEAKLNQLPAGLDIISSQVLYMPYGGLDEEAPELIKFTGPITYSSADRLITRSDYKFNLIKRFGLIDSITWGEAEEGRMKGQYTRQMVNKVYSTILLEPTASNQNLTHELGIGDGVIKTFSSTVSSLPIIAGLTKVDTTIGGSATTLADGTTAGILAPQEIDYNDLVGTTQSYRDLPSTGNVGRLFDGSDNTSYAVDGPVRTHEQVFIGIDYNTPVRLAGISIKSVNLPSDAERAFPTHIIIKGSIETNPVLDNSSQWDILGSYKLASPSALTYSNWLLFDATTDYSHYSLEIYGTSDKINEKLKMTEIRGILKSKTGDIDYVTGEITANFTEAPDLDAPITVSYDKSEVKDQLLPEIQGYINRHHPFSTKSEMIPAQAVPIDVSLIAYYDRTTAISLVDLHILITAELDKLFTLDVNSLGVALPVSDIIGIVTEVKDVDYVVVKSPVNTTYLQLFQYIKVNSVQVVLLASDRGGV